MLSEDILAEYSVVPFANKFSKNSYSKHQNERLMKIFLVDLLVTSFGAVTSIIVAGILALLEIKYEFVPYTWSMYYIPLGAFVSGSLAAGGYYIGARIFNHKPSTMILVNMLAISFTTYLLIQFLGYIYLVVDGKQISDYVPFFEYLDITIRGKVIITRHRGGQTDNSGPIGDWGYVVELIQIIGFSLGGFLPFAHLLSITYCKNCAKYYSAKGKRYHYYGDAELLTGAYARMAKAFEGKDINNIVQTFALEKYLLVRCKEDYLRTVLKLDYCKTCGAHYIQFSVEKYRGRGGWVSVEESSLGCSQDKLVNLPPN